MKKLTKKAIKEAANYMVMIDWTASVNAVLCTLVLEAETLTEAMDEATERFTENVYMLAIMEKTGETTTDNECNGLIYKEILRSRTAGSWKTIKQDGLKQGSTWGRYFFDTLEDVELLECSK